MSQADELLESITSESNSTDGLADGNIIIGEDRFMTVPSYLQRLGVQYDHNVETVTFDCPRYWDGRDLYGMRIYVNYMRPDESFGTTLCENVELDPDDSSLIHFDWTISGHVTEFAGQLSVLVCARNVDSDGNSELHWNSELNTDMYISAGMRCRDSILRHYPDIISQLLARMDSVKTDVESVESGASDAKLNADRAGAFAEAAATSENNAKVSETNAKTSEVNAESSALEAKNSETNAKTSEVNAANSAVTANVAMTNANESASMAAGSASSASTKARDAAVSEENAANSKKDAENSAVLSQSWAAGDTGARSDEATNNAKYWSDRAKQAGTNAIEHMNSADIDCGSW